MKIVRTIRDFPRVREGHLGFVPTMGAFHEGHITLMRTAKAECGLCAVSLFVNPTQFGPKEDFQAYPRDEERDFELAKRAGVDIMFAPLIEEIYPRKTTSVHVAEVSDRWEGESRPGHFDGVATVVAKLFHITAPTVAYFGMKDYQQCMVLRRMVEDLDFQVQLSFVETVREPDGLALSSRNAYLTAEQRAKAPHLYQALQAAASELRNSEDLPAEPTLAKHRTLLEESGFQIDYFALVDASTLEPRFFPRGESRLIAAARLGSTRLIDNCALRTALD